MIFKHCYDLFSTGFNFEEVTSVPGFSKEFDLNFKIDSKFLKMAQASMNNILKKKKKIDREKVLWVGIHVRRQDYQRYEMSLGLDPLKPSYYHGV